MAPVTLLVPAYQYPTTDGFWAGLPGEPWLIPGGLAAWVLAILIP